MTDSGYQTATTVPNAKNVATLLLSCVAILEVEKFVMEIHQYGGR